MVLSKLGESGGKKKCKIYDKKWEHVMAYLCPL